MLQRTFVLRSLPVIGTLALGVALNCGGGGGDGSGQTPSSTPPTATQAQFLQAAGRCATDLYAQAAEATAALDAAVGAYAADPSVANRDAARRAWEVANDLWQQAEVFQFGPAAPATLPGGRGLREGVYAWPLVSRCAVEQTLVAKGYEAPSFTATSLANTRGLAALEYLLFSEDTNNACGASASINTAGTWAALAADPAAFSAAKATYARVVAADVAQRVRTLADAWSPAGGNFGAEVANAGAGSATYRSGQDALNAINNALFYVEVWVRDQKLAIPLALSMTRGCAMPVNGICPNTLESPFANRSQRNVRSNLVGFRKLFRGCDDDAGAGVGFDDLLTGTGAEGAELATLMAAQLDASFAAVDALPEGAMTEASIAAQKPAVTNVFTSVGNLVSLMKSQFLSVLDLEPPVVSEGDND
ncbi:MAG TPA: imelysin family protein [Polyangiaceae bacterium]|nr:imelysin family protein [Polyangiaceae bacterium]